MAWSHLVRNDRSAQQTPAYKSPYGPLLQPVSLTSDCWPVSNRQEFPTFTLWACFLWPVPRQVMDPWFLWPRPWQTSSLDGASSQEVYTLITPEPWQRPQVTGPVPLAWPQKLPLGMTASHDFFFRTKIASSNLRLTVLEVIPDRGVLDYDCTTTKEAEKIPQSHQS